MTYNNKRYLKLGVAAGVTLVATYYFYSRDTIPSGSTTGGLIYGWLGFIGILVLMFLGIRKRWHASHLGTVQGWTSAHVYLGLLTILIIPMHAGFRFGLDVHTLAFVLLVVVVLSGIVGLWLYLVIPERLTQFERVMLPEKLEAEINQVLNEMRVLAFAESGGVIQMCYEDELRRLRNIKSQGWRLLFTRIDPTAILLARTRALQSRKVPDDVLSNHRKMSDLILQLTSLETHLASHMQLKNALNAWLYVHLPVSFAMLAAVTVHLLVVFYY